MTTTRRENASTSETRPELPRFAPGWNPARAWRLRTLYTPIARAVEMLLGRERESKARVLAVGGTRGALEAVLAHPPVVRGVFSPLACEVVWAAGDDDLPLAYDDDAFDCAVAVDWLPLVAPSRRRHAVEELCRVAREGVVLSSPFNGHPVVAAERAVNDLYRAATGSDHPRLGRHLEYGLPDLDATREWVGAAFPHVETRSVDHVALWQATESMAAFEADDADETLDAAGAAALPPLEFIYEAEPAYRTLVAAGARPAPLDPQRHWALPQMRAEFTALQMHLALEAAAQRRAFDDLAEAVTSGREREREEFRTTVASLAAELHEREAQLELLERELRKMELSGANQGAAIAIYERRIEETDVHVENLEREREATAVHVRNLEAERNHLRTAAADALQHAANLEVALQATRERVAQLERELADTHQHVGNLDAQIADLRAAYADLEGVHVRLLESRGGRALTAYVRAKQRMMGRE